VEAADHGPLWAERTTLGELSAAWSGPKTSPIANATNAGSPLVRTKRNVGMCVSASLTKVCVACRILQAGIWRCRHPRRTPQRLIVEVRLSWIVNVAGSPAEKSD